MLDLAKPRGVESRPWPSRTDAALSPTGMPHIGGHRHSDVSGGWLRAATFGAMDGLVSNTALIAGVAAAASAHTVVISGVAGLLAGVVLDGAGRVHIGDHRQRADRLRGAGGATGVRESSPGRAGRTRGDVRRSGHDVARPLRRPPRRFTATKTGRSTSISFRSSASTRRRSRRRGSRRISSFVMFAIGAIVPLIPYLLGYESLWAGVICGGVGLAIAGGVAARFTSRPLWWASLRQLVFGGDRDRRHLSGRHARRQFVISA